MTLLRSPRRRVSLTAIAPACDPVDIKVFELGVDDADDRVAEIYLDLAFSLVPLPAHVPA